MQGLSGRAAVVTGGGGAIGRAICLGLARAGCAVGAFDLDRAGADETAGAITEAGGRAVGEAVDITDYAAVAAAVADFEDKIAPVDVLVNCAGWDRVARFLDTEPAFWDRVIAINLRGPINVTHVVARGMAARRRGNIVNIASDAGRVGSSGEAVYSACKGGIIALTKSVARELASKGIRVNCVCPGPTDTPLLRSFKDEGEYGNKIYDSLHRVIPFRRLGTPDDVAGIVTFLAGDEASFITGQVVSVSGGLTMHG